MHGRVGGGRLRVSLGSRRAQSMGTDAKAAAEVPHPQSKELRKLFFHAAVPMVGFGIMDNTVMIQMGDLIDNTIGITLGISTLTACAFGQVFSDVSGVMFGGTVEAAALKLGLPVPNLTPAQRALPRVKFVGTLGGVMGVMTGCLLAMTQLLFKDLERDDNMKQFAEVKKCFETVMSQDGCHLGADASTLFLLDKDEKNLFSVATGNDNDDVYIQFPAYKGIAGKALTTGKVLNIPNAYEVPYFNPSVDKQSGYKTQSVLAVPIFEQSSTGARVVAVAQFINKMGPDGKVIPFSEDDVVAAERACRYIAMFKPIIDGLVN